MKTILVIDKVLLHNTRQDIVRGAELFNLALIKDLAQLGYLQTIVAASSWKRQLTELLPKENIAVQYLPPFRIAWINAVLTALIMFNKKFDYLFLTNVGNCVIPPTLLLYERKVFSKLLVIAHRTASKVFLSALKAVPATIISVNNKITEQFRSAGFSHVVTDYGIVSADQFYPKANPRADKETRFLVFGSLDSEWKGADTAINAFLKLPPDVQNNSSLHLAGYSKGVPVAISERIKKYSWIAKCDVPAFIRSFDILLVPSRDTDQMKETFSQTTVQGMLSGLAVIASDIPVLAEKLDDGGGLIFKTEAELTQHMATLHNDPVLRQKMATQARVTAKTRYVWDTSDFVKKYL